MVWSPASSCTSWPAAGLKFLMWLNRNAAAVRCHFHWNRRLTTLSQQWEFPPPPFSFTPSNFPWASPPNLTTPFSSQCDALPTRRKNQSDSFYGQCNSTFFKAADFCPAGPPFLASPPINQHQSHLQSPSKSMRRIKSVKVMPSVLFLSHSYLVDCCFFNVI